LFGGDFNEFRDAAGAIEETVVGMIVKVDEQEKKSKVEGLRKVMNEKTNNFMEIWCIWKSNETL